MSYDLFLTTFDRAETAGEAASRLRKWVGPDDVQVLDVVVLSKHEDGSAVIRELGNLGSLPGEQVSAIIGGLLGGLLGAPGGPAVLAASGAAGAAIGAASERLASRNLYHDDFKEFQQALAPGTSALLAILAPEYAAPYARCIADFGGETMQFSMSNDAGQEFQQAKQAFIARQAERRREQLAAGSSTSAEKVAELGAMNHELRQIYVAMSRTPDRQQADLGVRAAALRTRRDAARALLNQTLAAEVQRLDEEIARYQEARARATSEDAHAALTAEYETLRQSRVAAEQELAASQDAELQERWRDITALRTLAAHTDPETRITLDLQLTELRDLYAVAWKARSTATARALTNAEPSQHIVALGAQVQCTNGYGDKQIGEVTAVVVEAASGDVRAILVRQGEWPISHERTIPIAVVERMAARGST
jgi:uncharacterized membrane protein